MQSKNLTVLYERISRDEDGKNDSIPNQKQYLEGYCKTNNITNYIHLSDDNYSGSNFNRPGWKELIERIEADEVGRIIIKSLDRMGRDYLRTGLYREMFRERGIQLIAPADNFDSFEGGEYDFTPFKEIIAEFYIKDCSRKIRTIFGSKTAAGQHVTGCIPYGFLHDPNDRQKWIIDETAAKVVRHIFQLVIDGHGVYQIAQILEKEKVLIPTAHWESIGSTENVRHEYSDPYCWRGGVVSGILKRKEYMGHTVLRKTYTTSYKSKKRLNSADEDLLIFENTHPPIVSQETWELAQKLRKTVRRPCKNGDPPHRLTGLMFCGECGAKMTHDRSMDYREKRQKYRNEYICSNYRQRTRKCSIHFIRVPVLEELILSTIQRVCKYVRLNEAEFAERVRENSALQQESAIKETRKAVNKAKRRREELDILIKKLYESFATGKIPEKHFEKLLSEYDREQTELDSRIVDCEAEITAYNNDSVRADKFVELVKKYTEFTELTNSMVNEFIDRILVHEADRSTGKRIQQVEIYLNFIGNFDVPQEPEIPLTPEEIEAEEKAEAKRAKARIRQQAYREKRRAENEAKTDTQ